MPNKLQKRPPPPYSATPSTLDAGAFYESVLRNTKPPSILAPTEAPVLPGALMSNNPYNSYIQPARPAAPSTPAASFFSPVSPLQEPQHLAMTSRTHMREPERPTSSRSSVEIRRLDGTPYPSGQKQVKVAQDMHSGATPPAYQNQGADHTTHSTSTPHGCTNASCNKCGKRKTLAEQTSPSSSRAIPHYSRPISQGSTLAGPSSVSAGQPLRSCKKCGKYKKPIIAPAAPQPVFGAQTRYSASSPLARGPQAGLSIQPAANMPPGMQPQIDVIPPSASTYRPIHSAASTYNDEQPFFSKAPKQEPKHFRPGSLIRSLSRRNSKKEGTRTPEGEAGEQHSGGFMGLLRNQSTKDYHKLRPEESNSRPSSPFSFVETPNEEYFEMKPMKDKEIGSPTSDGTRSPSIASPTDQGETLTLGRPSNHARSSSIQRDDLMLSIPEQGGDNKPQLTRFKSLRSGVSRAASNVSRSNSLKRLGSIHQAFYRDDMSLDAHNDGERGTVAAF